jgi:hypothetical protein
MSTAPLLFRLAELGYPTRFYLPKGDFTESRLYFIRRLEENSSATSCQKLFRLFYQGYLTVKDYLDGVFRPLDTKAEGTAHYIIAA